MIPQILLSLSIAAGVLSAQTLALHQTGLSDSGEIEISVVAQLNGAMASGISFYVALPEEVFEVLGVDRPYVQGPLFAPAVEFINKAMPLAESIGAPEGMVILPYAAVRGAGADRGRTGKGVVARFSLRPLALGPQWLRLISTPIYESKIVLHDGVGEQVFQNLVDIELGGSGTEREKRAGDGRRSWAEVKAGLLTPVAR